MKDSPEDITKVLLDFRDGTLTLEEALQELAGPPEPCAHEYIPHVTDWEICVHCHDEKWLGADKKTGRRR